MFQYSPASPTVVLSLMWARLDGEGYTGRINASSGDYLASLNEHPLRLVGNEAEKRDLDLSVLAVKSNALTGDMADATHRRLMLLLRQLQPFGSASDLAAALGTSVRRTYDDYEHRQLRRGLDPIVANPRKRLHERMADASGAPAGAPFGVALSIPLRLQVEFGLDPPVIEAMVTSLGACVDHDPMLPTPPTSVLEARLATLDGARAVRLKRLLPRRFPGDRADRAAVTNLACWLALVFVDYAAWMKCREICESPPAFAEPPRTTGVTSGTAGRGPHHGNDRPEHSEERGGTVTAPPPSSVAHRANLGPSRPRSELLIRPPRPPVSGSSGVTVGSGESSSQEPLGGAQHDADGDSDASGSDVSVHSPIFDQLDAPVISLSTNAMFAWRAAAGKLASGTPTLCESPMPKRVGGCAWALARKVASLGGAHFPAASILRLQAAAQDGLVLRAVQRNPSMHNNHVPLGYGLALVMTVLPDSRDMPLLHGFLTYSSAYGLGCCPSSYAASRIMARIAGAAFARLDYPTADSMTHLRVRKLPVRLPDKDRASLSCVALYDACRAADFLPLMSFGMEGARAVPCFLALYRGLPHQEILSELEDDVAGIRLDDEMPDLLQGCANPGAMAFAYELRRELRRPVEPWARMDLLRAACALKLFECEAKPPRVEFPAALLPLLASTCDLRGVQRHHRHALTDLAALANAPSVSLVEGFAITARLLEVLQLELSRVLPRKGWSLRHWPEWYDHDGVFRRR
jgi:hypothetical protein